jgi:hypothetical protein
MSACGRHASMVCSTDWIVSLGGVSEKPIRYVRGAVFGSTPLLQATIAAARNAIANGLRSRRFITRSVAQVNDAMWSDSPADACKAARVDAVLVCMHSIYPLLALE